jgi:hypothetical protein
MLVHWLYTHFGSSTMLALVMIVHIAEGGKSLVGKSAAQHLFSPCWNRSTLAEHLETGDSLGRLCVEQGHLCLYLAAVWQTMICCTTREGKADAFPALLVLLVDHETVAPLWDVESVLITWGTPPDMLSHCRRMLF